MRRPATRATETAGLLAVHAYCNSHGLILQGEPREDFGVDGYIEVGDATTPLNFLVGVQIKSGPSHRYYPDSTPGRFRVYTHDEHRAYWAGSNIPIIFICVEGPRLWWTHVQAALTERALSDENGKSYLEFDEDQTEDLATYLRLLQEKTPSASHVLRVATGAIGFVVGDDVLLAQDLKISSVDEPSRWVSAIGDDNWAIEVRNRVIGVSIDGDWIAQTRASDVGPKCTVYQLEILRRSDWSFLALPLRGEGFGDQAEESVSSEEMARRTRNIAHALSVVGAEPVAEIPINAGVARNSDDVDLARRRTLALRIAGIDFELGIAHEAAKSLLELRATGFLPVRRHRVVAVIDTPAKWLPPEGDELWTPGDGPYEEPKSYEVIESVFVSATGRLLSLLLTTNPEHMCWGTPEYVFVHLSFDELRTMALNCIRD